MDSPVFKNAEVILANVLQDVGGDVVVIFFPDDFFLLGGVEDLAKSIVVGDVFEFAVFDEVDEPRQVVEDGGEMVFNAMLSKESVVLHF